MLNRLSSAAIAVFLFTGCARYEYDLVNPPDLARHIGEKGVQIVAVNPLEYRLTTVESRLVLNIYNPTPDPILIAGDQSYIVAPSGQSHPLRGQTIAPQTFAKFILPPMRPGYYETGPRLGLGIGFGYSSARSGVGGGLGFPVYDIDEPRSYTYYDESDATYWNWEGESDARIHLVFKRGTEKPFAHDFTFHRKKM